MTAFYDFYTNNVGKKDFIETIEPHNTTLTRFCIGRLIRTTFYGLLLFLYMGRKIS
jgi:hypothetical protein